MFGVDLAIVQVDVTRQVNAQWNRAERIQLIVRDLDLLKTLEPVDFYSSSQLKSAFVWPKNLLSNCQPQ